MTNMPWILIVEYAAFTNLITPQMRKKFSQAVLVIRDPYMAMLAEFNRQSGGHIGHAQPDKYTRDGGRCKYTYT